MLEEELPPQLVIKLRPPTLTTTSRILCKLRRLLIPKQQSIIASAEPGSRGKPSRPKAAVFGAVAVTVICVGPLPVTVFGEKLQVASVGSPEQLNETVPVNPLSGVTVIVSNALFPVAIVSGGSVDGTEKSAGRLMVYVAEATALL